MKTKRRRIVWGVFLVAVTAVCLAFYGTRHQPVARILLPDGTEIRIEYVTYGTEHRIPGANRLIAWASRQAQRWPWMGIPVYAAEYRRTSDTVQLCLWMTCYDTRTGKFLPGAGNIGIETDFGGADWQTWDEADNLLPTPTAAFFADIYERRKPEVPLKIWYEEKVFHVAIPNPAAKRQFPEWQAEPIPQKRRVGELDLVLRGITASPTDDRPELSVSLEVLHEGRPSQGLEIFPNEFVVLDATGNTGVRDRLPPFSEPVWMIRTSVVPVAGKYPIPATEGCSLVPW